MLIKSNGKKVLVEVKSTKYLSYVKKPQNSHIVQFQFYLHANKLKNGLILYIEKNTFQTKQFQIKYDKSRAYKIIRRFEKLHQSLKNDKIPAAEAKQKEYMKWMCGYCDYKDECGKN